MRQTFAFVLSPSTIEVYLINTRMAIATFEQCSFSWVHVSFALQLWGCRMWDEIHKRMWQISRKVGIAHPTPGLFICVANINWFGISSWITICPQARPNGKIIECQRSLDVHISLCYVVQEIYVSRLRHLIFTYTVLSIFKSITR